MLYPFKRTPSVATAFVLFFVASGLLAQERWFHVRVTEAGDRPHPGRGEPAAVADRGGHQARPRARAPGDRRRAQRGRLRPRRPPSVLEGRQGRRRRHLRHRQSPDETGEDRQGRGPVGRAHHRAAPPTAAQVDVRFPFAVLDAMFQGTGEHELDLVGAARALRSTATATSSPSMTATTRSGLGGRRQRAGAVVPREATHVQAIRC